MTKIKNMLISAIAIAMISTSSFAFEGFSVGATYAPTSADTKGHESTNQAGTSRRVNSSISKDFDVGSIFAEYTFAQGSTIGIDYIPGEAELGKKNGTAKTLSLGGDGTSTAGTVTASAELSDHMVFYAEPTYMMTPTFGVYVKGGAAKVTVSPKVKETTASTIRASYKDKDVWGVAYGIGAKAYYGNIFLKVEHLETEYGTYTHKSTTGDLNTVTADIDTSATRFALGYNF